jgi:hypothetical protein
LRRRTHRFIGRILLRARRHKGSKNEGGSKNNPGTHGFRLLPVARTNVKDHTYMTFGA